MKTRTFKIQSHGDAFYQSRKGVVASELRFRGQWLAASGFKPGDVVTVTHRQGYMEIALANPQQFGQADFQTAIQPLMALGL